MAKEFSGSKLKNLKAIHPPEDKDLYEFGSGCQGCEGQVVSIDFDNDSLVLKTGEAGLETTYPLSQCKIIFDES